MMMQCCNDAKMTTLWNKKKKLNKIHYKNRKFDLNVVWSCFFHQLSFILFLFCSYIFALSLDWATVFFCLSVVEITPHLVDKLFFDIYLLITVHFYFPNLDKKFFVLISALIVIILFLFSSKSHFSFKIVRIRKSVLSFVR